MTTQQGRGSAQTPGPSSRRNVRGSTQGSAQWKSAGKGRAGDARQSVLNESGWQLARARSLSKPAVPPPITGPAGSRAIFSFPAFGGAKTCLMCR